MSKSESNRRSLGIAIVATTLLGVFIVWMAGLFGTLQAVGEYLKPTVVDDLVPPPGCGQTGEAAPADLMRVVENQRNLYHLDLQKVVVCKSAQRMPALERRFAGLPFGEGAVKHWKPLSEGCCSVQHGRHVLVMVADSSERGTVLVEAALIQTRWDYLLTTFSERRASWLWRWCRFVRSRLYFFETRVPSRMT